MAPESYWIPSAIVGGNAVAAWVSTMDPGAVRNTVEVDMVIDGPDGRAFANVD